MAYIANMAQDVVGWCKIDVKYWSGTKSETERWWRQDEKALEG